MKLESPLAAVPAASPMPALNARPSALDFLQGGGQIGALLRAHDWAASALGSISDWPAALRLVLRLLLNTQHPMLLLWGPQLRCFYNDAFRQSLGPELHPVLLGAPLAATANGLWQAWSETIQSVLAGHPVAAKEDQPLTLERHGRKQAVWWSLSFSPVEDPQAPLHIGGVLLIGAETTRRVLAERRLAFELRLGEHLRELSDAAEIKLTAARLLGEQLNADRVGYAEIERSEDWAVVEADWTRGFTPSVAGRHHLNDFGPRMISALRAGRVVRMEDVRLDALAGTGGYAIAHERVASLAGITVPIIKDSRFVAAVFVHQTEPREWTDDEQALVQDMADHTWEAVQRAHADAALLQLQAELADLNETMELQVQRLLAERHFMADVFELNAAPIAALDAEFCLLAFNHAFADDFVRSHGLRPLPGQNLLSLLKHAPAMRERARQLWTRALRGEQFSYAESFDPAIPEQPYFELSFTVLKDRQQRIIGAVQYAHEIGTRLRKAAVG